MKIYWAELDLQTIGSWPAPVRFTIVLLVFTLMSGLGVFFDTSNRVSELNGAKLQEINLKRQLESTIGQLTKLAAYQKQLLAKSLASQELTKFDRPKGTLENYSLDSLHMVGTITQNNKIWALISAPDNAVYSISQGAYLGTHFAKIVRISPQEVELEEYINSGIQRGKRRTILKLTETNI